MRILRAEEKRIRRSYGSDNTSEDEDGAEKISDTVLSLDAMPEDDVTKAFFLLHCHSAFLSRTMKQMGQPSPCGTNPIVPVMTQECKDTAFPKMCIRDRS